MQQNMHFSQNTSTPFLLLGSLWSLMKTCLLSRRAFMQNGKTWAAVDFFIFFHYWFLFLIYHLLTLDSLSNDSG